MECLEKRVLQNMESMLVKNEYSLNGVFHQKGYFPKCIQNATMPQCQNAKILPKEREEHNRDRKEVMMLSKIDAYKHISKMTNRENDKQRGVGAFRKAFGEVANATGVA